MTMFEWAIIAFIVVSILWHVWKTGAANPESTGTLGKKVAGLSTEVGKVSGRVKHLEEDMAELKEEAATGQDIKRLEQLGERTWRSIERIERIILEKGLGK
ncbi:MAG: hypothetical protein J0I69_02825 [Altererythrobacter sp.]|nr:hypothetical protein [Altererythrobacter sp.]